MVLWWSWGDFHEKVLGLWMLITLNTVTFLFYIYFNFFILADEEESLNSETSIARTAIEGSGKGTLYNNGT